MKRNAKAICVFVFLLTLLCSLSTLSAGTPTRIAMNHQLIADHPEIAPAQKQSLEATVWLLQSDTTFEWVAGAWLNRVRNIYTYGANNTVTGRLRQVWQDDAWADSAKWTGTFDGSDRILTSLSQVWDDTGWANEVLLTVVYDDIDNIMEGTTQVWSASDGDWAYLSKAIYTYTDGLLATRVIQTWVTSDWVNSEQCTYTYDDDDLLTTLLVKTWSGSAWVNSARTKTYYNADLLDSVAVSETWSTVWDSSYLHQYDYDDMKNRVLDVYMEYDADSTAFFEITDDTLKFDAGFNVESVHYEVTPDSLSRVRHTYHPADGYIKQDLAQYLDGATWTNIQRIGYYWAPALIVSVDDQGTVPSSYSISQNYPNPFNPMTVIRYSLSQRASVCIAIFNVLGQEVTTLVNETQPAGTYETNWDGLDHTGKRVGSGVYFYRISAGNFSETRKMVLLK